jgi:hypothetical protein
MVAAVDKAAGTAFATGPLSLIFVAAIQSHREGTRQLHFADLLRPCDKIGMAVTMIQQAAFEKIHRPIMPLNRPVMGLRYALFLMTFGGFIFGDWFLFFARFGHRLICFFKFDSRRGTKNKKSNFTFLIMPFCGG